jgi:hypothetical protein
LVGVEGICADAASGKQEGSEELFHASPFPSFFARRCSLSTTPVLASHTFT